jgi:hypothetical protein
MRTITAILAAATTTSSWAATVELKPDVSPRGNLQFGFRCQYNDRDNMNFLWMVKTSQRLGAVPKTLYWSAFDTHTGRYILPWKHYEPPFTQNDAGSMTFAIEAHDEDTVHGVLRYLQEIEIHLSADGSGNSRAVDYTFPLGMYRQRTAEYFYDQTDPTKHCNVNEFDLPYP